MTFSAAIRLGRISNLPTVWTNSIAAICLVDASRLDASAIVLTAVFSLFYMGGMYLNDAFDADIDACERPERPIPMGQASRRSVFVAGFGLIGAGTATLFWFGIWSGVFGLMLATAVILYNALHKTWNVSPLFMAACRMLIYLAAGATVAIPLPTVLLIAGAGLFCYVVGLTCAAQEEAYDRVASLWPLVLLFAPMVFGAVAVPNSIWLLPAFAGWLAWAIWPLLRRAAGDVPNAVVKLIAGMSLYDAILIAGLGETHFALLALACFMLTLLLQRFVAGT